MKVLLTGATGFVGKALVDSFLNDGIFVVALVREMSTSLPPQVEQIVVGDLSMFSLKKNREALFIDDIKVALQDVNTIVHLAARVHVMNDHSAEPLKAFRYVNRDATLALAEMASKADVKRFVFISSIKVNGEKTDTTKLFKPNDQFIPDDPYGLSKYEAEKRLLSLAEVTELDVVIIRPPLVYGPRVKANFSSMMTWINKGIPLPFGAIHNQRSLVALENLVSFIVLCSDREKSPKAANEVFLISDGEDVSTSELLRKVAKALDKKTILLPIPVSWMRFMAQMIRKEDVASRLFGSLQVDSSKARDLLGWKPVITMSEQLKKIDL